MIDIKGSFFNKSIVSDPAPLFGFRGNHRNQKPDSCPAELLPSVVVMITLQPSANARLSGQVIIAL